MSLQKARNRDRKYKKKRYGMKVDGKSVLLIQRLQKERSEKLKEARKDKEK